MTKPDIKYPEPYSPIDPDFMDIIEKWIEEKKHGKTHFFDQNGLVNTSEGTMQSIDREDDGVFLSIAGGQPVRVDRIITLLGRPGPAYEAYDRYANACLTCEDLGQFGK